MDTILAAKIAMFVAAAAAFTAEDIAAVKQAETLGPDIAQNIQNSQALAAALDDETVTLLNQARKDVGLAEV